jgi:hypothetical protein
MLNWNGCSNHSLFCEPGGRTKVAYGQGVITQQDTHRHRIDLVDVVVAGALQFCSEPADPIERHDDEVSVGRIRLTVR